MIRMWLNKELVQALRKRFNLLDRSPNGDYFELTHVVQPVCEIDRLVRTSILDLALTAVTATGSYIVATVPYNERWTIKEAEASKSSGTFTIGSIQIHNDPDTDYVTLKYGVAPQLDVLYAGADKDIMLEPGWTIVVYVDTFAVNGNLAWQILYEREYFY